MKKQQPGMVVGAAAAAALVLLAVAGATAFQHHGGRRLFVDRRLSGPVTLKPQEWLELTPARPLEVVRDSQEITLFPDPPIQLVDDPAPPDGRMTVDGRDASIEAELVDGNGVTHRSRPGVSQRMTGDLKIIARSLVFKDLPRDVTYAKVRIRSSVAYPVKKVLWRCYNWGEVHH